MDQPIIYIDVSKILDGKVDELRTALVELVEFVNVNESLPFAYNFYFNQDNTRMTLIQIHPNAGSLELHLQIAGTLFQKFSKLIKMESIELYGTVSDKILDQLNKKAAMLGGARVQTHQLQEGFIRFSIDT
jgi:hypothetical protein